MGHNDSAVPLPSGFDVCSSAADNALALGRRELAISHARRAHTLAIAQPATGVAAIELLAEEFDQHGLCTQLMGPGPCQGARRS